MRTGTMVSLGASAVLGLGALVVARVWLPSTTPAATAGKAPQLSAQMVPVVVAKADIPYGTKLDPSKLEVEQLPAGTAPQGAYSTAAQILTQAGGAPVVLTAISAREPLLPTKLSTGGARPTIAAAIDEGMRAYTIQVSETAGVGGNVLPGDRVDVIVTRQPPTPKALKDLCDDCKLERSDVVLQNVKVLGMDLNVDPASTQTAVAHTATLEVQVQDAQRLAVAAQIGTMTLALRRVGQADVTPVRTVEIGDVRSTAPLAPGPRFPDDAQLNAPHPRVRAPAPAPAPGSASRPPPIVSHGHVIVVVHGDSSTTVEVPAGGGA
jgi:pilus assembly protein CpaB